MSEEFSSAGENPLWQIVFDNLENRALQLTFAKTAPHLYSYFHRSYTCSRMDLTYCGRKLAGSSQRIVMRPLCVDVRQFDMPSKRLTFMATEQATSTPACIAPVTTHMRIIVLSSDITYETSSSDVFHDSAAGVGEPVDGAQDSATDVEKSNVGAPNSARSDGAVNCGKIDYVIDLYRSGNSCTKLYIITRQMIIDEYAVGDTSTVCVADQFIAERDRRHLTDLSTIMKRKIDERREYHTSHSPDELSAELTQILMQIGLSDYPSETTVEYVGKMTRKVCNRMYHAQKNISNGNISSSVV